MFEWVQWSNPVAIWWIFLTAASAVNICVWFFIRMYRFRGPSILSIFHFRKNPQSIIWLSFLYTFVCAFRSIMPRADVQRICLFDTWFSSVFLGRSLATIAELAFIAQWSIILGIVGIAAKDKVVQTISRVILVTICVAECCSWFAVITRNYLGNSIEESLWGITYIIVTIAMVRIWTELKGYMRLASGFAIIGNIGYVCFMFTVDVPMYVGRLLQDRATGKEHLGFVQGIIDLNTNWVVTHSISDWQTEIPWMTLYFTFAVLVSLALCMLPLQPEGWQKHLK
jgi:hypothetical protein